MPQSTKSTIAAAKRGGNIPAGAAEGYPNPEDSQATSPGSLRVLVVEDEALTAFFLTDILEELGHEVCAVAKTVAEALQAAKSCRPDLALLDINLGKGGDGVELAMLLNERHRLPHLYTTAYTDAATITRVRRTNPLGIIKKPYDGEDIEQAIALLS